MTETKKPIKVEHMENGDVRLHFDGELQPGDMIEVPDGTTEVIFDGGGA